MRRAVVVALAIAVAAIALMTRWRCGDSRVSRRADLAVTATSTPAAVAATRPPDPRTQARGRIAGRIRDDRGTPVSGAIVCAEISTAIAAELRREPRCTTASPDGTYELRELYAAMYAVTASAPRFRPSTFRAGGEDSDPWFRLAAGEAKTGIDIVFHAGGVEIRGVVLDVEGGPIARAWVQVQGNWGSYVYSPYVATDAEGRFSVWTFPGGSTVEVEADGYATATAYARAPAVVEVRLTPEASLAGTIVDAQTGAPIEGADVVVSSLEWEHRAQRDRSDAEGRFRARRLLPGRYVVTARTDTTYGRSEGSILLGLGQSADDAVVRLSPAAQVTGKIVIAGPTPAPCRHAEVALERDGHWRAARVDDDGSFVIGAVTPGTYEPRVWCPGTNRRDYPQVIVEERNIDGLVWEVDPRGTAALRGRVTTKRGVPVPDASISVSSPGADTYDQGYTFSRADGTYAITGLRGGGTYRVGVSIEQFYDDFVAFATIGRDEVREKDLRIDVDGTIRGTLVDERGTPVVNATIHSLRKSTGALDPGTLTDASGAFTIAWLPPGEYRVTAHRFPEILRKPGVTDDSKQGETVIVKSGETATVKLVVDVRSSAIRGVVVDGAGAPIGDAYVVGARETDAKRGVHDARHWPSARVLARPDGTFELTDLAPGSYTVRAYRNGGGEAIAERVATGSSVRMQIRPTAAIEGVVTFPAGRADPVLGVTAFYDATSYRREEQFYRTQGRFVVRDLPAGSLRLIVTSARASKEIEIRLGEGEHERVTVPLDPLVTLAGRIVDAETKQPVATAVVSADRVVDPNVLEDFRHGVRTDANGRFALPRAPTGRIQLQVRDDSSRYGPLYLAKNIAGEGTVDVGDVLLVRRRDSGEPVGKLGVAFVPQDHVPSERWVLQIAAIEAHGPAAGTALRVGDVITTIDGIDVKGSNQTYAWALLHAPRGTKLALGLERGVTIDVKLR